MRWWLVGALLAVLASGASAEVLHLGTTPQLAPFVPVVLRIVADAGLQGDVELMPQARVYGALRTGLVDGAFFLAEVGLSEVPGMAFVPVVLFRNDYMAVATSPEVVVQFPGDLARYSVAVERGNSAQERLVQGVPRLTKTIDQRAEFLMLASGRVDVAIASRAALPSLLAEAGITSPLIQEPPLYSQPLYLGLVGNGLAARDRLTRAFQKAMDDGSWARDVTAALARLK